MYAISSQVLVDRVCLLERRALGAQKDSWHQRWWDTTEKKNTQKKWVDLGKRIWRNLSSLAEILFDLYIPHFFSFLMYDCCLFVYLLCMFVMKVNFGIFVCIFVNVAIYYLFVCVFGCRSLTHIIPFISFITGWLLLFRHVHVRAFDNTPTIWTLWQCEGARVGGRAASSHAQGRQTI